MPEDRLNFFYFKLKQTPFLKKIGTYEEGKTEYIQGLHLCFQYFRILDGLCQLIKPVDNLILTD